MQVKIKKIINDGVIPQYAKPGDAGLDLVAVSVNNTGSNVVYGTGLAIEIPEGYVGLIFPRSSVRKYDLSLANSVGVIDSGYRGEIMVSFRKLDGKFSSSYNIGDKVAQLVIMPYPQIELVEVEDLSDTERGEGGHGSTGE